MSEVHPFRLVWETGDLDQFLESLADTVVLRSPVLRRPFVGKAEARELYQILFTQLDSFEITDELPGSDAVAMFWRARAGGQPVEGADLLRTDAEGKISEISVYLRPLVSIGAFNAAIGPDLSMRLGRWRPPLVRFLTQALSVAFALTDRLASLLVQRR